jgi:hypothetical protein
MINWVIGPQLVVTLYIYRVGRSCPARKPFYKSKFARIHQFYSDSGSTGQIGVAIVGSAKRPATSQIV